LQNQIKSKQSNVFIDHEPVNVQRYS